MDPMLAQFQFSATINDVKFRFSSRVTHIEEESAVTTPVHKHFFHEFHFIFSDGENIQQGEDMLGVAANDFVFIPSGVYHRVTAAAPVTRYCFTLELDYHSSTHRVATDYYNITHTLSQVKEVTVIRDEQLKLLMEQFRTNFNNPVGTLKMKKGLLLVNVILRLLDLISLKTADAGSNAPDLETEKLSFERKYLIEEFISCRYADPVGISALASILFLSRRQTQTAVKNIMGADFKQLIVRQRVTVAKILIRDTKMPLEEIASHVGYNSYSGFYMAFCKEAGISPVAYREEIERTSVPREDYTYELK